MQTLNSLKRRIDSTEDLQSVVRTMKSLAAVNIRRYEKAVDSLLQYARTLDMAFGIVLQYNPDTRTYAGRSSRERVGAVVFGSDQGMCGSLNEQVVDHAVNIISPYKKGRKNNIPLICSGVRASTHLADAGLTPRQIRELPGSIKTIGSHVGRILVTIEQWLEQEHVDHVMLFHARPESHAGYTPHTVYLLPMDAQWIERRRKQKWESRTLPFFTMDVNTLFSDLVREYLYIGVHRAFVESMAAENAARLAAMQGAEKNIEELMDDLTTEYHQLRQMSITEELLDIVSGFEALEQEI